MKKVLFGSLVAMALIAATGCSSMGDGHSSSKCGDDKGAKKCAASGKCGGDKKESKCGGAK